MRRRRPWLPADDEAIIAARSRGESCAAIAAAINRTKDLVIWRVRRLIKAGRLAYLTREERETRRQRALQQLSDRWTPEEDARIDALREQGYTKAEIATQLKRPQLSTASRIHILLKRGVLKYLSRDRREQQQRRGRVSGVYRRSTTAASIVSHADPYDLGYIAGVLYGDGFIESKRLSIGLKTTNLSFADAFERALQNAFGERTTRTEQIEPFRQIGPHTYHDVVYYGAWLHRRHITTEIRAQITGDTRTHHWSINVERAVARGPAFCRGLVQGLFDSDGSYHLSKHTNATSIQFGTASATGATSLADLLIRMGFSAKLTIRKFSRIYVHTAGYARFAEEIGSRIDYKRARLEEIASRRRAVDARRG